MDRFSASKKLHASIDDVTGATDRRIYRIEPQRIVPQRIVPQRIVPQRIVLFDEENVSANPQLELLIQR